MVEAADLAFHHRQFDENLSSGDMFALFERTREAIELFPDDPVTRYLQALAVARLGEPHAALRLYERNRVGEIESEDAAALKGRLLKDLAVCASGAEQIDLFRQSSAAYRQAHRLTGGYFSGVNGATTAFLAGDEREARQLAAAIARRPDIVRPNDYFAAASGAEAMLVCGDVEAATAMFGAARRRTDASPGLVASTARQVGLIASRLSLSSDQRAALLASVRPTPIIHYCGHMLPFGSPIEQQIAEAISAILSESDVLVAYGSLACGADILVAEAILARGGELHLVLPFAEEDFLKASVSIGGVEWLDRYADLRKAASSVTFATQMRYVDDEQFAYCSKMMMGLARLRARIMSAEVFQLAVWDGVPPTGIAGTASDCAEWARQGGVTRIVAVAPDRPTVGRAIAADGKRRPLRTLQSMLFADFSGYSRLEEDGVPQFLEAVMGRIASILDRHGQAVLSRNSWGDAIYVVFTSPEEAAEIALEIQSELSPASLRDAGLPADGGMRMSLHHGPIFAHFDAIRGAPTFYGTEVTLAARIEPRVPVGAIYTTQPFAAIFDPGRTDFHFEYVGKMHLAKNYGERILYRLGTNRG